MCVGYEFLLLPNKMPTKTPNCDMSVDSCFLCFSFNFDAAYAKSAKFDLAEKFKDTLFIHQIFANAFAVRKNS